MCSSNVILPILLPSQYSPSSAKNVHFLARWRRQARLRERWCCCCPGDPAVKKKNKQETRQSPSLPVQQRQDNEVRNGIGNAFSTSSAGRGSSAGFAGECFAMFAEAADFTDDGAAIARTTTPTSSRRETFPRSGVRTNRTSNARNGGSRRTEAAESRARGIFAAVVAIPTRFPGCCVHVVSLYARFSGKGRIFHLRLSLDDLDDVTHEIEFPELWVV